jgi:ketosteroid isomerase-like protein
MLHGGKLRPEYIQTWANYFVRFVQEFEKAGIPVWGLTVQNEPMAVHEIHPSGRKANYLRALLLLACVPVVWISQDDPKKMSIDRQQAIESAVVEVHAKMQQAAQQRDVEALYEHVLEMDKGVIIEDGHIRWTRQEASSSTRQGLQGLKDLSYTYTQKYVTVVSPTEALWVGEGTSSATLEDGRQISVPFAETIVFVQRGVHWKVLHAHRSVPNR